MSQNLRTLLTVAAEMRAVGHPWAAVAAKVHRKVETCQKWPNRFRDDWADLFRTAQMKRFDETSNEAHSLLKCLMRDDDGKVRLKAIEVWLKCGAAAYGAQGQMVVPGPCGGSPASRSGLIEVAVAFGSSRTPCQIELSFEEQALAAMQFVTWSPAFSQTL